jgi:chromosome segregation ATPase
VADAEVRLRNQEGIEAQLRRRVKSLETRLADHVSSINKIQPKYQEALNERAKFQLERDAALAQTTTTMERIEARIAENMKLKEQNASLSAELSASRDLLAGSSVPEIAELEKAHEEARALQSDKEKLERRVLSMNRDFEFTRDSYQKASSSAAELAAELASAHAEIEILKRKASDNIVRIAEIQRTNETAEREARIDELEGMLIEREQELYRKGEELKIKTNGRRETRGTSVPQSPRLGSGAMSPRARVVGSNGSRQNSPAPGETMGREGFRDAILFPSAPGGSSRWNHLREGM